MALFDNLLNSLKRLLSGEPERRPFSPSSPVRPATIGGSAVQPATPVSVAPPRPQPEPVRLTELDGNPFAPLTDAEVKKQARGLGSLWNNPWFGRRDLIPPADDPRTLLIDRAMTSHGLLTPDELQEIHSVGAQMDAIRPDLAVAHQMATAVVKRSQEEHEALKQRKKSEAAERRRMRAEAVAMRRAGDIVFLGRGVSRRLADREAHVERLERLGLPVLAEPSDVAEALSISIPRLRWLAFHNEAATRVHYVRFTVPKKSGGVRELSAPHRSLAAAQQWILENILSRVPVHDAAHGFVTGRSTVTNAALHAGRRVVLNADLKDFFPTITFPRVRGVFENLGYSPAAATILALLSTESPRRPMIYAGQSYDVATGPRALPQGACTSPALSNLVARRLDSRLGGIAAKLGWTYTRYADDLTFSADGEAGDKVGYLLARIRHIAQDEGFAVNESKTRVQRGNTAQTVTGLVVNRRVAAPRATVRRLRAILHRARWEGLAAQNRSGHPHFEAWVRGMIAYISMANAEQGGKLQAAFDSLGR
ncbi:MAG TPA: reverse transcriptase family protein [Pirellulales bacterium]|nr:reverse transcriptase family protein [Pirellulales bacterium]